MKIKFNMTLLIAGVVALYVLYKLFITKKYPSPQGASVGTAEGGKTPSRYAEIVLK